ncbi:hypothetical protein XENOCAPTIV_009642, partial [Xenoophorus captivus]
DIFDQNLVTIAAALPSVQRVDVRQVKETLAPSRVQVIYHSLEAVVRGEEGIMQMKAKEPTGL